MLTIPDEATFQTYTVTSAQSAFPFTFAVFSKADLRFSVDGVELDQADFTLSGTLRDGGGYQGGTINLNDPVASASCTAWRDTSPVRAGNYSPATSIPVRDIDVALNRVAAIAQDEKRDIGRAFKVAVGDADPDDVSYEALVDDVAAAVSDEAVALVEAAGAAQEVVVEAAGAAQVDVVEAAGAAQIIAVAAAATGTMYASTAAGISATSSGDYFVVAGSGDVYGTLYSNTAGVATFVASLPSSSAVTSVNARSAYRALVPLVIFAGESNSGGNALNTSATVAELGRRPEVQIYNPLRRRFEDLKIGTNNILDHAGLTTTTHGWELQLANQVAAGSWLAPEVYVVKTGQGGSTIAQWDAADALSTAYFHKAGERIVAAMDIIRQTGRIPVPVIWYSQAINDAVGNSGFVSPSVWFTKTREHLNNLRQVVGFDCPIVMTHTTQLATYATYDAQIDAIAADLPGVYAADTTAANAFLRDTNHWDYTGMKMVADLLLAKTQGAIFTHAGAVHDRLQWDRQSRCGSVSLKTADTMAVGSDGFQTLLGTIGRSAGKYVFEVRNDAMANVNAMLLGLARRNVSLEPNIALGGTGTGTGCSAQSGAGGTDTLSGFTIGTALGARPSGVVGEYNSIAVDLDAGKAWVGVNGTYNGAPAAGTNPWVTFTPGSILYPAASLYGGTSATIRGEAASLAGALPSGFSAWAASAPVVAPANIAIPFLQGSDAVGDTVHCYPGGWDGSPALQYAYQWLRDGVNIASATMPFYRRSAVDVGAVLSCTVTAVNGAGAATATATGVATRAAGSACVWDVGMSSRQATYANSNADILGSASAAFVLGRGTKGRSTGLYYFEIKVIAAAGAGSIFAGAIDDASLPELFDTFTALNCGAFRDDGFDGSSGDFTPSATVLGSTAVGRVIGVALNMTTRKGWLLNNNVAALGDPVAGTSPSFTWPTDRTIYPMTALSGTGSRVQLFVSGLTYAPPTGFSAWG